MRLINLFYALLLCLCIISLVSCHPLPKYTYNYIGLEKFKGDTLYLRRVTGDRLKLDRDYGKAPLDSKVIRNGMVTFSGAIDTLHLYYIEGKNCSTFFYPELGEVTHTYLKTTKYSNPQSIAKKYKALREKGFPKNESRNFMFSNLQNAMGVYLLDHIGYYPNELDKIYKKSNLAMRDTVSLFLSLKKQLSETKELNRGNMYIDFDQRGFEHDSIHFFNYFNRDKVVCLFFFNGDSSSFFEKIIEINNTYNNVYFVGYSNKYITDFNFVNVLKRDYKVHLFDDRGKYEKSVMYKYRVDYRIATNYYLIFSSDGRLIDKYIN